MDSFIRLCGALNEAGVRYVVMGVWGINHYAQTAGMVFSTEDRDLFLPADAANLVSAWAVCEALGFELWAGRESLDIPRDELIANRIVEFRALTMATGPENLRVDLSLVMGDFKFHDVFTRRVVFEVDGIHVPVANVDDIIASKAKAGREKDRLFLATHEEALKNLLREEDRQE